jgi:hypothetical protein
LARHPSAGLNWEPQSSSGVVAFSEAGAPLASGRSKATELLKIMRRVCGSVEVYKVPAPLAISIKPTCAPQLPMGAVGPI